MPFDPIRRVDARHPEPIVIQEAARAIAQGHVIVFPTRCLYGLGADALNPAAVERVFALKCRPESNPILVLVPQPLHVESLAEEIPPFAKRIMERIWPGGVTLVLRAKPEVPEALTAGSGKIGVRLPAHPVAAALARAVGGPITGTSANVSGQKGASQIGDIAPSVLSGCRLFLDAGPLEGGPGSTVVDMTVHPPSVLREGAVSKEEIQRVLEA